MAVARYWAEIVLQQHAPAPAAPRYKPLNQQQVQRLQRVCELLSQTQHAPVSTQSMRAVLTPDEYAAYRSQLSAPQSHFDLVRAQGRPDVLDDYVARLKTADFTNARATAAGNRANNYSLAVKLRNQSEHEYENACEYLQEQLDMCSAAEQALIQAWLDRPFEYGTHGTISIDCVGVARVIGSNSKYCLHKNERAQQQLSWQLQCQQHALSAVAYDLLYLPEPECAVGTGVVSKKLQSLLANLRNN